VTQVLLVLAVLFTVGVIGYVLVVLADGDSGLPPAEPDGRAVPLPGDRPLAESDLAGVRFDVALRGYRMRQVDRTLRRAAYDIGYKDELVRVLVAEVDALREGRTQDAEVLRRAREAAVDPAPVADGDAPADAGPADAERSDGDPAGEDRNEPVPDRQP
jgi:DivIVA domain-containing protein